VTAIIAFQWVPINLVFGLLPSRNGENRHLQLIKLSDKIQAIEKDNGHQTGKSDEGREQVSPPSNEKYTAPV